MRKLLTRHLPQTRADFFCSTVKRLAGLLHYQVVVRYRAKASALYQHLAGLFGGTVQPGIASRFPVFSESAYKSSGDCRLDRSQKILAVPTSDPPARYEWGTPDASWCPARARGRSRNAHRHRPHISG
jgi:hypothetical protein